MAETWVINDSAYQDTQIMESTKTFTINFVSNNNSFNSIIYNNNPMSGGLFYDSLKVVDPDNAGHFINQDYRTVTFGNAPTGALLAWLQDNAEKQQSNIELDLSTIGLTPGNHSIQIKLSDNETTKVDSDLSNIVTYVQPQPLPQLSAPTNLTADGTTISFDEVENAESYEVFADGISIGECTPVSGYTMLYTQSFTEHQYWTGAHFVINNDIYDVDATTPNLEKNGIIVRYSDETEPYSIENVSLITNITGYVILKEGIANIDGNSMIINQLYYNPTNIELLSNCTLQFDVYYD